ncbi:hypothetical protein AAC387_Pa04g2960 [Persea americana]
MANDAVLRSCLLLVGAVVLLVGIYTHSFKKMFATYFFGLFAIAGLVLPDWEFFDRDFSQWFTPMPAHGNPSQKSNSTRFRIYPLRMVVLTTIYGFGLYKWWMFITN